MTESYSDSALRHYADAQRLAYNGHLDGAGYLIGYAVECAIKHAIEAMRPAATAPHKHLPDLVEPAKKALQGRRKHAIYTVLHQNGFMNGWKVDARYQANGQISALQYELWRKNASSTLGAANLRQKSK